MKRLGLCLAFLAAAVVAHAAPITVAWDANPPTENVVAYRIGDCQQGTQTCATVGETAGLQYGLDVPLSASKCYRVRAINNLGVIGDWSEEVCMQPTKPSLVNRWRVILYVPQ